MSVVSWLVVGTWQETEGSNWQNTSRVMPWTQPQRNWAEAHINLQNLSRMELVWKSELFQKKLTCNFKGWQWLHVMMHATRSSGKGCTGRKAGSSQQKSSAVSPSTQYRQLRGSPSPIRHSSCIHSCTKLFMHTLVSRPAKSHRNETFMISLKHRKKIQLTSLFYVGL